MKITFKPAIKPWDILKVMELDPIKCPKCGSKKVWTHTLIHARAWVNLNTAEIEGMDDGEVDLEDARNEPDYVCYSCDHEWEGGTGE